MTQYIYVCDDGGTNVGTATAGSGIHTTPKTGAWSALATADYYATAALAMADWTPTDAEDAYIIFGSAHAESTVASQSPHKANDGYKNVYMSVSMADITVYEKGASLITTSSGGDFTWGGTGATTSVIVMGLSCKSNDDAFRFAGGSGCSCTFYQCTAEVTGAGDRGFNATGQVRMSCIECDVAEMANNSAYGYSASNDAHLKVINSTMAGTLGYGIVVGTVAEGHLIGCDFSSLTGSSAIAQFGSNSRRSSVIVEDCALPVGVDLLQLGRFDNPVIALNSAPTAAEREYSYTKYYGTAYCEDNSGVYRNDTYTFSGGAKCSYEVNTDDTIGNLRPFIITLKPRYVDLTDAASDTLTVHFSSADSLDNADVYAVVRYPDSTDKHKAQFADNAPTLPETRWGISGTPTSYTDNAEGWFNGPANTYSLSVTVTGGAACVPVIDLYIAYDTGINPLYVCPKIDVS